MESETPAIVVTKAILNSGGGIVSIQPQESRIFILPVIETTTGLQTKSSNSEVYVIIYQPSLSVPYIPEIAEQSLQFQADECIRLP